jgi:uncharacterized membrane protein
MPSTSAAVDCCWLAKCIESHLLYTRGIIIALALIAFCIATDLALYQTRVVQRVWDPVFDGQSERVLDSNVSRAIRRVTHIPDAALGALAYLTEILFCLLGAPASRRRVFRVLFALNSLALVLAGLALVALQAFVVHAWCLLCLTSASISVVIAILAATELRSAGVRQT